MTDKKMFNIHSVTREEAGNFLKKAREHTSSSEAAFDNGNYSAAVDMSVLGAIAACDAVLGMVFGIGTRSLDHRDAVMLFRKQFTAQEDLDHSKYLNHALACKKTFMYESRMPTRAEAKRVVTDARIFLDWTERRITGSAPGR
jgi:uncharacterized protein (UPF0332 family)